MAKHNEIGEKGEVIVSNFLKRKGFLILDRNYRKKWGELDIVAEKDGIVHFVEVKTVVRKAFKGKFLEGGDRFRPEDNMHPYKIKRLQRVIQTYLLDKYKKDPYWQFDLACLFYDPENNIAKIRLIEDLVL